jgi:hypothetical protein
VPGFSGVLLWIGESAEVTVDDAGPEFFGRVTRGAVDDKGFLFPLGHLNFLLNMSLSRVF